MIPSRAPDKDPNSAAEIFTIVRLSCETWVTLAHYQLVISPTKSLGHRAVHLRLFLSARDERAGKRWLPDTMVLEPAYLFHPTSSSLDSFPRRL